MIRKKFDRELVRKLTVEGKTVKEIADAIGCSFLTVYDIKRELGLTRPKRHIKEKIIKMVKEHPDWSNVEIARYLETSSPYVWQIVVNAGMKIPKPKNTESIKFLARIHQGPIWNHEWKNIKSFYMRLRQEGIPIRRYRFAFRKRGSNIGYGESGNRIVYYLKGQEQQVYDMLEGRFGHGGGFIKNKSDIMTALGMKPRYEKGEIVPLTEVHEKLELPTFEDIFDFEDDLKKSGETMGQQKVAVMIPETRRQEKSGVLISEDTGEHRVDVDSNKKDIPSPKTSSGFIEAFRAFIKIKKKQKIKKVLEKEGVDIL